MKLLSILTALAFIASCVSTSKSAKKWDTEEFKIKEANMVAFVSDTGNVKRETLVTFHGLGDIPDFPVRSRYGAEGFAAKINAMGVSHVLGLGYVYDGNAIIKIINRVAGSNADPAWMLIPEGDGPQSVKEFNAQLLKFVKKQKLPQPMSAIGISMGGSNLITLALKHPETFREIKLVNPMLRKDTEWKKFEAKDYKNPNAMPGEFFTQDQWNRYNAFHLLDVLSPEDVVRFPAIWVTACREDQFGLFQSTEDWVTKARDKGLKVTFVPATGCDHFSPSLAF